jgi:dynein heavy chain
MEQGGWALLQNCHLGLDFMVTVPDMLKAAHEDPSVKIDPNFRLWITCEANDKFPIGLLQIGVHVTREAPQGMKAGLINSYSSLIDKDRLDRVDHKSWKHIIWGVCFMHSIVLERRKFGPIGW